jgi:hypothetical protein
MDNSEFRSSGKSRLNTNEIVASWSAFAAALVALLAIIIQQLDSGFDKRAKFDSLRTLVQLLCSNVEAHITPVLQGGDVAVTWGINEERLVDELGKAYSQTDLLDSYQVNFMMELLSTLTNIRDNSSSIRLNEANALYTPLYQTRSSLNPPINNSMLAWVAQHLRHVLLSIAGKAYANSQGD